ncbi:hypothetical protein BDR22DRAFT_49856 [Usnea florida]
MDPLSALSLASNIVQLVDVGTKVVSATFELYSPDGITINGELECVMSDLVKICSALERPQDHINGPRSSNSELELIPLSKSCKTLGEELLTVLNSLKVQSPHKKWQSFRQALKAVWKEKAIERYKDRITDLRSEISLRLISILRDEQSNVALALNKLSESHRRLEIRSQNQAAQLQTQITTSLDKLTSLVAKDCREPTSAMADLTSQLSALAIEGKIYSKQLKVIESLRFEMIFERRMRIVEAYPTTFEWLFAKRSPVKLPGVSMLQWLQECNGIYWVSGKAGSGKSTLMKFLVNDERTQQALKTWAGGKRLIVASYFFWNAGTDMQKSQLGLLQTLLYTVLQQCPALVSQICRSQMEKAASSTLVWTRAEVLEVLKELGLRTSDSTRFCFFIDGLDEFDGEHTEVLDVMESLTSDHIKICFSSRPWNVFQNAYGANCGFKLQLQDINRQDIMRFVKGTLSKDRHFRHLKASDNRYDDLVNEIVERASGVFLWVFLVVQSLRRGMCNSDTISELQDRLRILPTELEEFFQHILDSVEKVYHRQAARIYLICLSAKDSAQGILTTMTASFFDEEAPNFVLSRGSYSWDQDEIQRRMRDISKRILARCTDLIEVSEDHTVEFLHRTVHDFLHLRDIQDLLVRRAGADFNAHQYMCNATLSQILVPTTAGFMDSRRGFNVNPLVESFLDHAYAMEFHSKFTNVRLLKRLDRVLRRLCINRPSSTFRINYQENWLILAAVQNGLYGYLHQETGQVRNLVGRMDINIERPLLDIALRPMEDPLIPMPYVVGPDSRVVSLLLENGADPNERCGGVPIWKRFMDDLVEVDEDSVDDRSGPLYHRTEVIIIEMLLRHGANFTMSDIYGHFDRESPSLFTSEEAAHLKNIMNTTRGKRQRSASTASQDPPSKRPSGAAIDLPYSRPDL